MSKFILLLSLVLVTFAQTAIIKTYSKRLLNLDLPTHPQVPVFYSLNVDGTIDQFSIKSDLVTDTDDVKEILPTSSMRVFSKGAISMAASADGANLFVSGQDGKFNIVLRQIDASTFKVIKDYGIYAGDNELPIVASNDNKFLFTGGDNGGNDARVKIWDIQKKSFIAEYAWGFNFDIGMTALALSNDNKFLYVGSEYGGLQEFDLTKKDWSYNYSKDSKIDEDSNINSMFVTADDQYLFISNDAGYIKQFDVKKRELTKNWGIVTEGTIYKMIYHKKTNTFFTSDSTAYGKKGPFGTLKHFDVKTQSLIHDYGVLVEGGIVDMAINDTGDLLLISGQTKILVVSTIDMQTLYEVKPSSKVAAIAF